MQSRFETTSWTKVLAAREAASTESRQALEALCRNYWYPLYAPAGDALSWPSLDIDVYVPGLIARAFGTRLFAAATGRQGGRRRSKAKAAAAKANGAKGGRPRKRPSA